MKMVHGNAVSIREEAKPARNTHRYMYIFNAKLHFFQLLFNFPEHNANYTMDCKKLFAHVIMTWGITHKLVPTQSWKLHFFSTISSNLKKGSSMKGPKSSFWVSSYLNQWLIVSDLQNQSVTDRQTDRMITISLSCMCAEHFNSVFILFSATVYFQQTNVFSKILFIRGFYSTNFSLHNLFLSLLLLIRCSLSHSQAFFIFFKQF